MRVNICRQSHGTMYSLIRFLKRVASFSPSRPIIFSINRLSRVNNFIRIRHGTRKPHADRSEMKTVDEADYLGVGTVFPSPTKPELAARGLEVLKTVRRLTRRPLVAIGGIDASNAPSVMRTGVDGIAVASYLMEGEDVRERTFRLVELVKTYKS